MSSSLVGISESLDVGNSIFIRNDDVLSWWLMFSFETSINFMSHETAFLMVTAMRTYNLTKFFNFETSNTLVLHACAQVWIISPRIQTLDNVIILPMHLRTLFPGLRNKISIKILRILRLDFSV